MLSKGKGEVANVIRPLLEKQTLRTPETNEQIPPGHPSGGTAATSENEPHSEMRAAATAGLAGVRTLSLQVPAPSPLLPFGSEQFRPSEQYRIVRTKISHHPSKLCVIAIASPASGDGKSVTAINTAGALALKNEAGILLIDGDLRKSVIHTQLGLPQSPGLADVLSGACTLEDALVHTKEFPNLYALSSGTTPANPVELLDSRQWRTLITKLRGIFRYVIIDSPPVGAVADYDLIQAISDGVILVIRPDHTNRKLCRHAIEIIPKSKFLGVLLNCVRDSDLGAHATANYYYYGGGKERQKSEDPTP
jgi:capsular exopolysaccharide synthesis family protein